MVDMKVKFLEGSSNLGNISMTTVEDCYKIKGNEE